MPQPERTPSAARVPELVEAQIAEDRALYDAAGITEPLICPLCGRAVPTFRDGLGMLRMEGHRARLDVWCGGSGREAKP